MSQNTEFSVQLAHRYDQRGTLRWLVSHVWRYKLFAILTMACYILAWLVFTPTAFLVVLSLGGGPGGAMLCLVGYLGLLAAALAWRFRSGAWKRIELIEPALV